MVAQTIKLPNIRKMYVPDEGYVLIEVDLARADAQVVAWESNDNELKQLFRSGANIHDQNALSIYGGPGPLDKGQPGYSQWYHKRQRAKTGVHAVNYGCQANTLSAHLECNRLEAQDFIDRWFGAHPRVLEWHERVKRDLQLRHCVDNKFGYKRHYFDRIEGLLPEALAWIGQSTVAIACNHILLAIEDALPYAQMLLQVHDSNLFQIPKAKLDEAMPLIYAASHVEIAYDDPLVIPPTFAISEKSWGDVHEVVFSSPTEWSIKGAA